MIKIDASLDLIKFQKIFNELKENPVVEDVRIQNNKIEIIFTKEVPKEYKNKEASLKIEALKDKNILEEILQKIKKEKVKLNKNTAEKKENKESVLKEKVSGEKDTKTKDNNKNKEKSNIKHRLKANIQKEVDRGFSKSSLSFRRYSYKVNTFNWVNFFISLSTFVFSYIIVYIYILPFFANITSYLVSTLLHVVNSYFISQGLETPGEIYKGFSLLTTFFKMFSSLLIILFFVSLFKIVTKTIKKERMEVLYETQEKEKIM